MDLYSLIKPLLFRMDAERAHHFTIQNLQWAGRFPFLFQLIVGGKISHPSLQRELFGLKFSNPVGLAAGLDKNGEVVDEMAAMGFGFIETGTITPYPQPGNEKPRLFRLLRNEALINRMGFNNVGAEVAAQHLKRRKSNLIVGVNIGKNKSTPNEQAVRDYEYCFKTLFPFGDYFVVNVSSPNTPGLRALQDKDSLTSILTSLQDINQSKEKPKPLLLKISPDLTESQLDEVIAVALQTKIHGLVATNTTIGREKLSYTEQEIENYGAGGLSGQPLTEKSTDVVRYIAKRSRELNNGIKIPIIGVGGIMNTEDAISKLDAGADLLQLYTGFIYRGPRLIRDINRAIMERKKISAA